MKLTPALFLSANLLLWGTSIQPSMAAGFGSAAGVRGFAGRPAFGATGFSVSAPAVAAPASTGVPFTGAGAVFNSGVPFANGGPQFGTTLNNFVAPAILGAPSNTFGAPVSTGIPPNGSTTGLPLTLQLNNNGVFGSPFFNNNFNNLNNGLVTTPFIGGFGAFNPVFGWGGSGAAVYINGGGRAPMPYPVPIILPSPPPPVNPYALAESRGRKLPLNDVQTTITVPELEEGESVAGVASARTRTFARVLPRSSKTYRNELNDLIRCR